jgi:hypothetical protein
MELTIYLKKKQRKNYFLCEALKSVFWIRNAEIVQFEESNFNHAIAVTGGVNGHSAELPYFDVLVDNIASAMKTHKKNLCPDCYNLPVTWDYPDIHWTVYYNGNIGGQCWNCGRTWYYDIVTRSLA